MSQIVINGAGRLGREIIRQCMAGGTTIAAINDPSMSPKQLEYMLKYDTVYFGKNNAVSDMDVIAEEDSITINGKQIPFLNFTDWGGYTGDLLANSIVIECTGTYTQEKLQNQFYNAGAARVIVPYLITGVTVGIANVNEKSIQSESIYSTGTADAVALSLIAKIVNDNFGVENATSLTLSAYNNLLSLTDYPNKKLPVYGRAAAQNMIPVKNFSAADKVVEAVLPELSGKFGGQVCYTAILAGAMSYIHFKFTKSKTLEDVKVMLKLAAESEYKGALQYAEDSILPSDILATAYYAVITTSYIKQADTDGYEWIIPCMYDSTTGFAVQTLYMANTYGDRVNSVSQTYAAISAESADDAERYVTCLKSYVDKTNEKLATTASEPVMLAVSVNSEDNASNNALGVTGNDTSATGAGVDMDFYNEVCEFLETLETA